MRLFPEFTDSIESRFANLARARNAAGQKIISLGLGEPAFPTPPEVIEAAYKAMRDGFTRYSDPLGLFELRSLISGKLAGENGVTVAPEHIVVTPGAKMALSLVLAAVLRPGDEVINILPCYPSYLPQIRIAEPDARIVNVNLRRQDFGLDLEGLSAALNAKTKAIILNFPHNPTGHMLSSAELDALVELKRQSDCYIISDEIYERLNFSGAAHLSPAKHPELAARTFTINGFAKSYSMTGWRIGYIASPDHEMTKLISKYQQHLNTNTATFVQKAACATFTLSDDILRRYNQQLGTNEAFLRHAVAASPQLSFVPSQGGLFAFVNISLLNMSSDSFATLLMERHGVAATPGYVFGADWYDHIRISLAIDPGDFRQGIDFIVNLADEIVRRG